jgi:pimeloyl-ACP methyl ester carboxylesterase
MRGPPRMSLSRVALLALLLLCAGAVLWLYTPDQSRASLEARYASAADSYMDIDGVRLRVRDTGPRAAPALILLHGFGSSLETWQPWAERLSAQFRVIRLDLPGFGLTGPDPSGDYSDARSVALILSLMDRLGLRHATLIGNSLGGKLAWMFAAAHPERVTKLVLISPDGFASPGFAYGRKPDVPLMVRALPYVLPTSMLRMSLAPAYADPKHLTPAVVARYRDMMLAPGDRAAMIARMRQVMLADPVPTLQKIQTPTLLLWGEQDAMIPFSNAADYQRAMPHATLVRLPNLGHVPFEEAPAESLVPVRKFLEDNRSP